MGQGALIEMDHPYRLLVNKIDDITITNFSGAFSQMCIATGEKNA